MNQFFTKLILCFIIINSIKNCPEGKYGENCEKNCSCTEWSTSNNCSIIEGRCLDCKFGHFGPNCGSRCYPTCKTNLCCEIKSKDFKESNNILAIKNSILHLEIENKTLNISVDFNVGHPLTIFYDTAKINLKNGSVKDYEYIYTKYPKVKGKKYENNNVKFIGQNDFNIELPLPIILYKNFIPDDKTINGVIGLGFYNSINDKLYKINNTIDENIASFKKNGDDISVLFGDLFKEEKKYVHKLSFCPATYSSKIGLTVECKLDGLGSKNYVDVLKLNDTYIKFSMDENSKFVLPKNEIYIDYIKKYYFKEENYRTNLTNGNSTLIFCYQTENINRLSEFGFVINHFFYYFSAKDFFIQTDSCQGEYSTFVFTFSDEDPEIIFGKNLYSETQFTLDNEEEKIYFYSKNVEFFSGEIKSEITESLSKTLKPLNWSLIVVGISFFLNIASFLVFFYFKRKKEIQKFKNQ